MSAKRPKVFLTLEQRVAAIKLLEQGRSAKSIALEFGCGRTQIQSCGKRKAEVMAEYEHNSSATAKRPKTCLNVNYGLDSLLVRWITDCNNRRIPLSGPLIQEKARKLADDLGIIDFKGSNGWLEKFKKRSNIVFKSVCGERGDVNQNIVDNWKERLPTLCEGYNPCDIFNMDETGLFFKQGKATTFCVSGTELAGGKRAKDRITVALCASMTGEKLKPLVIGKSRKPRCFSRVNVDSLPVTYRYNKKSWMNGHLFEEWVNSVNKLMRRRKRNILLFVDNAPSHPPVTLSNVKVVFLPPNTTSVVQPMDQGIIQTMKLKFYQQQSQHIISEMDKSDLSGTELLKQITVLDTIYWINRAWNLVETSTIVKCFEKCGFSQTAPSNNSDDEDQDDNVPLLDLARKYSTGIYGADIQSIISATIPTCDNHEVDWDRPASEILESVNDDADSDSDSETMEEEIVTCSVAEASEFVKRVKDFACVKGNTKLLNVMMEASALISEMNFENKQTKITDFFKQ